jgi:hypothetical protein
LETAALTKFDIHVEYWIIEIGKTMAAAASGRLQVTVSAPAKRPRGEFPKERGVLKKKVRNGLGSAIRIALPLG